MDILAYTKTAGGEGRSSLQEQARSNRGVATCAFALSTALALSAAAISGAQAEPVVVDGGTSFHRVYIVGSGDDAAEDAALANDLNALRADLEQGQNHLSLNSSALIQPPRFFLDAVLDGIKTVAQPGDAVTLYLSGRGNVDSFRLSALETLSATDVAGLLDGFAPGVTRTVILDSCFGGSFADDIGSSTDLAVIGTSTTCPFDAPFEDFVQTFSDDLAELAGQQAADADADGIVTAAELESGLLGRAWKLGEAAVGDVVQSGKSKCDGSCGLPAITVTPPACGEIIDVAGAGFSALDNVGIEVLDSNLVAQGAGNTAATDAAGGFAAVPVEVPTAPTLVVASDGQDLQDWHYCETGGGVPPDDTDPTCDLVAGVGVIDASVQDLESGLAEIDVRRASNLDLVVPAFDVGTTDPVDFQATIVNPDRVARLRLRVTDVAGNSILCSKTVR